MHIVYIGNRNYVNNGTMLTSFLSSVILPVNPPRRPGADQPLGAATMQTTATELMTKLTQVGNTLDQLDFRKGPELTQAQAKKLLRARARSMPSSRRCAGPATADGCLNDIKAPARCRGQFLRPLQEIRIMTTATKANGVQVTPERIIPALWRMVAQIDDELDTSRELTQLCVLLDRRKALRGALAELAKDRKARKARAQEQFAAQLVQFKQETDETKT